MRAQKIQGACEKKSKIRISRSELAGRLNFGNEIWKSDLEMRFGNHLEMKFGNHLEIKIWKSANFSAGYSTVHSGILSDTLLSFSPN